MASLMENRTLPRPVPKPSNDKNAKVLSLKPEKEKVVAVSVVETSAVKRSASVSDFPSDLQPAHSDRDKAKNKLHEREGGDHKKDYTSNQRKANGATQLKKITRSSSESDTVKDKGDVNKPKWNSVTMKPSAAAARKPSKSVRPTHVGKTIPAAVGRIQAEPKNLPPGSIKHSKPVSTAPKQNSTVFTKTLKKLPPGSLHTRLTGNNSSTTLVETRAALETRLNDITEKLFGEQEKLKELEKQNAEHIGKMNQLEQEIASMNDCNGILQQRMERVSSELSSCRDCIEKHGFDPISKETIEIDKRAVLTLKEAARNCVSGMKHVFDHMQEEEQRMLEMLENNLKSI